MDARIYFCPPLNSLLTLAPSYKDETSFKNENKIAKYNNFECISEIKPLLNRRAIFSNTNRRAIDVRRLESTNALKIY